MRKPETRDDWEKLLVSKDICGKGKALGMLIVLGALRVGAVKQKVTVWLKLKDGEQKQFEQGWKRLVKYKVFENGKVHGDLTGKDGTVELILLGLVADGMIKCKIAAGGR